MSSRVRVRPLMQLGSADCGPACLRMVLGHFGRHVSARDLNPETVSARDGVTAAWLVACARRQGLHAEGYEVSVGQLSALPTPAILHTTSSHFVVFEGLHDDRVVIVDPNVGRRWYIDHDEARRLLSGTAIAFEPGPDLQRQARFQLMLNALAPVLTPDRRTSGVALTVGLVLTAFSIASGMEWLWSLVLGSPLQPLPTLTVVDRLAVLVSVAAMSVMALRRLLQGAVRSRLSLRLMGVGARPPASDRVDAVSPYAMIDPITSTNFPDASSLVVTASLLVGTALTTWLVGGSVAILLAAFSAAVVVSIVAGHLTLHRTALRARRSALKAQVIRCVHVLLCAAIWLAALHLDGAIPSAGSAMSFPRGVHTVVPVVLLAIATYHVGGLVALGREWLTLYLRIWEGSVDQSSHIGAPVADGARAVRVAARPLPDAPLLQLRDLTLDVGDARDRLLSDLALDLNEGEHVAVVGPTGTGKTTLAKAILGRLHAAPGAILYRGRSLGEYSPMEREQLVRGTVQGDGLLDSSIARILRTGNLDASPDQSREVCARLGVDEEFSRLPLGYATPVNDDGDTLSRGQRQMLLVAQVAASGARILVLDDPVSALDDAAARRVLEGLATLPSAVVITMASASALCDLDFRVIHLGHVAGSGADWSNLARR